MAIHISVSDENLNSKVRVAGSLDRVGAMLLRNTCSDLLDSKNKGYVDVDLNEVSFLGEAGARILCELKREPRIRLNNIGFLADVMLTDTERH